MIPSPGDRVVVAGYGVVGQAIVEVLEGNGISPTVVDVSDDDRVDIVGEINDGETLFQIDIETTRSVVLALDSDTTAMYTTVAIEEVAPDVEVMTRVNDAETTTKLYRAGVEYVLALSAVTGRMLSSVLLEEDVLTPETQFDIVRTTAPELAGRTLEEVAVRDRIVVTIVAIERNGALLTNPGAASTIEEDDRLIITGSDDAVNTFIETFR